MQREQVDIFVAGGGLAGLIAAAVFGQAGFSVLLADPAPQAASAPLGADLRSTAFLRPARALFQRIGLWQTLAPHSVPLDTLEAVDTVSWPPEIRARRAFAAAELGPDPFGWNLMNGRIRREVLGFLAGQSNVTLAPGCGFAGMLTRQGAALVRLSDGRRVSARLVIGADGRASAVREAAGIGVKTTRYGQKALAFSVTHPVPHGQVSTEIYNRGGAFTLVPLPDLDDRPASAVVWMNPGREALRLNALSAEALDQIATERSCGLFGALRQNGGRQVFPVITQRATHLVAERTALVAEAAHVLPPIGAQGLNTSLNDVAALLDLALATPGDLGGPAMLAAYARARETDIARRAAVIDLFNRVCQSGEAPVQFLRRTALQALYDIAPLRRGVMRAGLGGGETGARDAAPGT